jgi:hypothetical protein
MTGAELIDGERAFAPSKPPPERDYKKWAKGRHWLWSHQYKNWYSNRYVSLLEDDEMQRWHGEYLRTYYDS